MTDAPITEDLTAQKALIDAQHVALKDLAKRYPDYIERNKAWFIEMAGELCAATFCNERGDFVMAQYHYERAEPSIDTMTYKLGDCATDYDF